MNSTTRFSDRVDDYVKYRPSYPKESLDFLVKEFFLIRDSRVADVGAGTGIFSALLLDRGLEVFAVEPNDEMRGAAEKMLSSQKNFHSVRGSAEATTLTSKSVDVVVAAQAFHWFDAAKARYEFSRIVKPGGGVALIWNSRSENDSEFARGYEQLLKDYGVDYHLVKHRGGSNLKTIEEFWAGAENGKQVFANSQRLDLQGIKGRLTSSSYAPKEGHPSFLPMMKELERLFSLHHENDVIEVRYETEIFYGRL